MPRPRKMPPLLTLFAVCCTLALFAAPAAEADWLITLEGRLIETDGPWTIDGETLTYTDLEGRERSLAVDEVDLEGSQATTALKEGRTWSPPPPAPKLASDEGETRARKDDGKPPITLYQTSWCGYCRKARKLLEELDADFAVKDVERNPKAATEYRKKAKGYRGIPLIDFDGEILRGYDEAAIRRLAREVEEKQGDSSDS